jgi:hypothetical protein
MRETPFNVSEPNSHSLFIVMMTFNLPYAEDAESCFPSYLSNFWLNASNVDTAPCRIMIQNKLKAAADTNVRNDGLLN